MAKKMTIYVVHHSHTDIGYTDLQEKITYTHVAYIRSAVQEIERARKEGGDRTGFKWNCETYFCVERFLEECSEEERKAFFDAVRAGSIGISASYLNFTDLVDIDVLQKRAAEMHALFAKEGITVNAAMNADVNGVPLGMLDVFVENGVQFFYTNIHCHHGMYPLYQNQKPYFWESASAKAAGKRLLVWNGEHYNLGNVLGIAYNKEADVVPCDYEKQRGLEEPIEHLKKKTDAYLQECWESGYAYDFIPISVSGVFSDNAPPNPVIAELLAAFNRRYGEEITFEMVTVSQLYERIKDKVADAPVYRGDLTDWWAHGVGSVPDAVKHYKEAQRVYALCNRLDPKGELLNPALTREAEDNMLLFAEHTYGHSAAVTDPYDTIVKNLDIRNVSYASKAYEAAEKNLVRLLNKKGDTLRYYNRKGRVKAINTAKTAVTAPVQFYVAAYMFEDVRLICEATGAVMETQVSRHPRGALITFIDTFQAGEEKTYRYEQLPFVKPGINTRHAYSGAERIRDIVNDYDPLTYTLDYGIESDYFRIEYEAGRGVTSFYDKTGDAGVAGIATGAGSAAGAGSCSSGAGGTASTGNAANTGRELLIGGDAQFFTPLYERTPIRPEPSNIYEERRLLGRNIQAHHTEKYQAHLTDVKVIEAGPVFKTVELLYTLEGTLFSSVVIQLYNKLPRVEFKYRIAKTMSYAVENVFLPLALNTGCRSLYFDKGGVPFRPGIDQIPGTCMEYYIADSGLVYSGEKSALLIQQLDTALLYTGELKKHPILLCDGKAENNRRPVYSWIMNNIWETNFRVDLSGIGEYRYLLTKAPAASPDALFSQMKDTGIGITAFIIE